MKLVIGHLYPRLMNIYGDRGNITALVQRCRWRGIKVKIAPITLNTAVPSQIDLLFGGGGQDIEQQLITPDLQKKAKTLKKAALTGLPMLVICGLYQLFGHYFKPHRQAKLPGISIFDAYTVASLHRKIGHLIVKPSSALPLEKPLVGFENHSGETFLGKNSLPLGTALFGYGNNSKDQTAGAVFKNCFGTYLHGPILPQNPHLADWLIHLALQNKYGKGVKLTPLNDRLEWQAHRIVLSKAPLLTRLKLYQFA